MDIHGLHKCWWQLKLIYMCGKDEVFTLHNSQPEVLSYFAPCFQNALPILYYTALNNQYF